MRRIETNPLSENDVNRGLLRITRDVNESGFFPVDAYGGSNKKAAMGKPIVLEFPNGIQVESDIYQHRNGSLKYIRCSLEGIYRDNAIRIGDKLIIVRQSERHYSIRNASSADSAEQALGSIEPSFISYERSTASANEPIPGAGTNGVRQTMSLEEFQDQLDRRSEIGKTGEQIAMKDELLRLGSKEIACPDPARYVEHVALTDVGRGYDIESKWPGHERCIEVKSSTNPSNTIFMSSNERSVLKALGQKAWLYRVVVNASGSGEVMLRLNDPISEIPEENFSTAVWQVRLLGSSE